MKQNFINFIETKLFKETWYKMKANILPILCGVLC